MTEGHRKTFFEVAGIVAAATMGDGVFALPYVFYESGWLLGLFYLLILGAVVVMAHVIYFRTLEKVGEKERLLGLARIHLGRGGFWVGFFAIVVGLLLTLVAYLILGAQFIRLGFPDLAPQIPLIIFWLFVSVTVLMNDARVVELELLGVCATAAIVIFIFFTSLPSTGFGGAPAIGAVNPFIPFGAILFSLAGWTAIEPAYEARKKAGGFPGPWRAIALGTVFAGLLYALFVTGILGSTSHITPDTISGLTAWPSWKRDILAALGLVAVWTVSIPLSREIKNSLEKDLKWNKFSSRFLILFLPIFLVLVGFNNFLIVVGLVGGLFLSLQYLLIVSVGRRVLALSRIKTFFLDVVAAVFVIAAVYSVYVFIVR